METVTHSGRTTAYEQVGSDRDGKRALYVHGSGADREIWRAQLDEGARPAVALDLSGHGDSADVDADPGYETLSAYADDVLAVADATDAEIIVGNSLGGAICQHLALERDASPAGLVLAGTGAKLTVMDDLRAWLDEDFDRAIEFLHGENRLFHDTDHPAVETSKATMAAVGQATTRRDFETCHRFDVRGELDGIDVPTLAVCGEHDGLTPPRYHEYLAENVPNATTTVLADAAHLAMIERPAAFDDTIDEFVRGIEDDTHRS
ncbi:alpha/beta fold hydrolase [Halococcus saccharolyticus]|uniref:Alpha/beta fold family hydrolase n=1 Tax=Halococcus saccharolyticus DSM 5350 TaxID=1227455 RepID=M0MHQ6_9EURY|nr:alpha/beta fold hydrolase [Halococcus saccharolyticus]EMA44239.1 alpha/beta fold family hydrolase [Halococcus saccharolyticus DSM 5350]